MGVNFAKTFGANSGNVQGNGGNNADKPKAKLWMNIGYLSDVIDEETGKRRFVPLPTGIPLDTQERVDVRSRNREFAAFQQARNDLLDQCIEIGMPLEPGEDIVYETESGLAIQIRKVNEEQEAVKSDENQFGKKLALGNAA